MVQNVNPFHVTVMTYKVAVSDRLLLSVSNGGHKGEFLCTQGCVFHVPIVGSLDMYV